MRETLNTSMVIDHQNFFEWDGVWYGITGPPKCGCRSLRDTIKHVIKPPNQTGERQRISAEHSPNYTKIFEEFGRPDRFEVIMLIRNPYHRLRSLWRNCILSLPVNKKFTFAQWITAGEPLDSVLFNLRHGGGKVSGAAFGYQGLVEYIERFVKPHNPDKVHFIPLENRLEAWKELNVFDLPEWERWPEYKSAPDGLDDVEYYRKNPEILEIATALVQPDLDRFGYSFDNMTPGYGVEHNWKIDEERMLKWYIEYFEGRFRYFH